MKNIKVYKEKVNDALKRFLDRKLKEDGRYSKEIKKLIENIIEYNMRDGKRIRPLAIIFAYKCFKDSEESKDSSGSQNPKKSKGFEDYGKTNSNLKVGEIASQSTVFSSSPNPRPKSEGFGNDGRIVDAAISLELMQAFLLIHDDIMDRSDLRRGGKTMHKIYEKKYSEHFGISMAILAGDLCASYCYDSIIETSFGDMEKTKAIEYISWIINREVYGQTLDIIPGFKELKEEDIWKIYELKTATYTMQGPIYLGCVLSNASKDKIKKLQDYAYNLGIAFQIQDDLNGIFGEIDKLGKPNDSDIKEGKKTLIIAKALELCNDNEKEFLLNGYGNSAVTEESMKKIREIIKKCGAYDYCRDKFHELIEKSKKSIADVELRKEGKEYLIEMADYIGGLF